MDVSVIITAYNESRYLPEAIESVLTQTRQPDEILLVDAGSTDATPAIVDDYATEFERIRSFHITETPSIPRMRNLALKRATGDLVTFLDGDDRFRPEKLERELETYWEHRSAEIVFSNVDYVDEDGNVTDTWCEDSEPPTGRVLYENAMREWPRGNLFRNELVSLDLLERVGRYDEQLPIYEDWDLKIRAAVETEVAYCPATLAEYRNHAGGVSSRSELALHAHATRRIYQKNQRLFERHLPARQRADVGRAMKRRFHRYDAFASKQNRSVGRAVSQYVQYMWYEPTAVVDYRTHLRFLLPKPVFDGLKQVKTTVSRPRRE